MRDAQLLHDVEKGRQYGKVTTARTPSRVIGFQLLLCKFFFWKGH